MRGNVGWSPTETVQQGRVATTTQQIPDTVDVTYLCQQMQSRISLLIPAVDQLRSRPYTEFEFDDVGLPHSRKVLLNPPALDLAVVNCDELALSWSHQQSRFGDSKLFRFQKSRWLSHVIFAFHQPQFLLPLQLFLD